MSDSDIFDWDAYHRDTRELSLSAKGAWWDCLYKMRLSVTRGRISMPMSGYARMFGSTVDQAKAVLDEISEFCIGDAVTERNGNVTLTNRRMFRDWEKREADKIRQRRHRAKNPEDESTECHASVTNGSKTFSSSSEKEVFKQERKEKKKSVIAARIPDSFPITQSMVDWANAECPGLNLLHAHDRFVEYWTNNTTKKAEKVDWLLTWKNGMKLALKWQLSDTAKSKVGKYVPSPEALPQAKCGRCFDSGTILVANENGGGTRQTNCPECSDMAIAV